MATVGTSPVHPKVSEKAPSHRRIITLASLAFAVAYGGYITVHPDEPGSIGYWFGVFVWPGFPLLASLRCLKTAFTFKGRERRAWQFIALGCFCMFSAEVVWAVLEISSGGDVPITTWNTFGYAVAPICFVTGMLFYQDRSRAMGVSLVQAGNLGIVFSTILFGYLLVLFQLLQNVELGSQVTISTLVEGASFMATSAIGLSLVSLHFRGQKRAIMGLVLIGMLCVTVEYFSFIYFLINDLVSLENPLYVFYLMASAMWFLAASEQDRLEPEAKAPAADAELEEHAKQWETLFPSFAVAGVFVLAFFFHNSFNEQTLPYLAAIAVVFVASLGARNWWGQRVETRLTAESKNSAALLLTANRMLREEVRTRTRAEEELRQSQKMEALGQLTGGVAHDFNNLLGVIQGNLELASLKAGNKEGRPTPSGRPDPISNAMDAVAQGASLTQYLLALSRKQALNPQPVDVVDLLLQTRNGLERTLGKAIKVRIKARNNPWTCLADRPQLESALLNLALNARDAMPEGGEVSFETINAILDEDYVASHPDVESGKYLMISVSDTGKGITKEHLKKVWDPFFTSKKKGEGTGLGLSTVYGFAKQSGGHVSIQSEVGVGTEVRLYLPKTDAPVRAAEAAAKGEAPLGNAETLLLVEDDDRLRGMLAQILEGLNYNVFTAASGSAALSILSENPATRLVLTDVMLVGGISGVDLEKEIRERELPVKVLLMSGYPAEELMKTGHHSQEVDLLPKPFTRLDVARKIRSVLEK